MPQILKPHRSSLLAIGLLLFGLSMAALVAWRQADRNDALAQQRFDALSERIADQLVARIQSYEYGLRGARGAVVAAGERRLSRSIFDIYMQSREIDREFPGARGFGFIRRVPEKLESEFVAAARADGWPDFSIRYLTRHDGERYIIQYIEPVQRNLQAVGLDIASEDNRRTAAQMSLNTGRPILTAPITLVQATGLPQRSFLFLLPVYRPDMPLDTAQHRNAAGWGWVYAPLIIDEILASADTSEREIALLLDDVTPDSAAQRFYARGKRETAKANALAAFMTRQVFGRTWRIDARALPEFYVGLNLRSPLGVFASWSLVAVLLAALSYAYASSQLRKQQILAERLRMARIVENSSDAIIAESLDGSVIGWNAAAERIFGYRADDAIGRNLQELIATEHSADESAAILRRAVEGEEIAPFDSIRRCQDGSIVEVSIVAVPIKSAEGQIVAIGKSIRDIGERKRAERQLQEFNVKLERQVRERTVQLESARHDLRTLLDAVPSMIGYWDRNLINRIANHAYHAWFGVDPGTLPGRHMKDLLGAKLFELNRPYIEAALRGESQTFERAIPIPNGVGYRHALAHYLPDVRDGEVKGFYVIVHDVTDLTESRRKLAAVLRENEELLKTLHKHAIVSIADRRGKIVDVNDAFCAISGYSREELIGSDHRVVNSGTHSKEFWAEMWRTIGGGKDWHAEVCNRAKDGSLYWVESVIAPFFDEDGCIKKYISIRTDITARKTAARELLQERERLANILRGTNAGTWELNFRTKEGRFNERYAQIIGYTLQELGPLHINTGLPYAYPEDVPAAQELFRRHIAHEIDEFEFESRVRHRDGSWRWVLDRGRVMTWTADGKPEWMFGTRQDVTARREMEESLRFAMKKAEAANAAKSEFLANMSHEIRTPLNAIIGLAFLLEDSPLSDQQRGSLTKIQVAGRSLLAIINDVLDLSKIEAGEMQIEIVPFDLSELLREVEQMTAPSAGAKGLSLVVPTDVHDTPTKLLGDVTRIRQILTNLLSNAVKFTERGVVELSLRTMACTDQQLRLRCMVRDSGIGIAADVLPNLFSSFTQADASITRRFGGTGLGLSIVKQLAELMGGQVGVASQLGKGSEFWVELPLQIDRATSISPASVGTQTQQLHGTRILVVDDSDINLEVAQRILEREGAKVCTCVNGLASVERLRDTPSDFDVVLMDVQMPVMDGNTAARHIREELRLTLPIIALTAGALVSERQRALESGMDDFVSKPLDPRALIQAICRHLDRMDAAASSSNAASKQAPSQAPTVWPRISGIDMNCVVDLFGDDVPLFVNLLDRFVEQYSSFTTVDLPDLADAESRRALTSRVHKLSGSAATMGANDVHRLASQAEVALKSGAPELQIAGLLQELATALAGLVESVKALHNDHSPDQAGEAGAEGRRSA